MDGNKKSSSLSSILIEIVIAGVLVVAILGTLNYFGILPLSSTFSFLSFLPQQQKLESASQNSKQGSVPSSPGKKNSRQIVIPPNPLIVKNNKNTFEYLSVPQSFITVSGETQLDIEIGIKNPSQKTKDSSGLIFSNGVPATSKDYKFLRLFYYVPNNNWALQYKGASAKPQFLPLNTADKNIYGRFSIKISGDGKNVEVIIPNGDRKSMKLEDSIYSANKLMHSTLQIGPSSEVDLYSLYYQF